MRSKIGTKSRLTAHMLALLLLILMLVYIVPSNGTSDAAKPVRAPQPAAPVEPEPVRAAATEQPAADPAPLARHAPPRPGDTLDKTLTPVVATHTPEAQLRPDGAEGIAAAATPAPGISARQQAHSETLAKPAAVTPTDIPLRPAETPAVEPETPEAVEAPEAVEVPEAAETPEEAVPAPETIEADSPEDQPSAEPEDAPEEAKGEEPGESVPDSSEENVPPETGETAQSADIIPPSPQPDESGSLVVEPPEAAQPVAATTPLPNANLEVLGDGVFWLDSRLDLEHELGAIPDIGTLVLLTPLPGYQASGFEHVKTEAIPADAADLNHDSAEHFLHVTGDLRRPIVVAPLSGARGAAFFKGAYLLANRNLSTEDVLREVEPELDQAGEARDEIVHRLLRLAETLREE